MDIISVGSFNDSILVTVSIPKAPLKPLYALSDEQDIVVGDLSKDEILGFIKEAVS